LSLRFGDGFSLDFSGAVARSDATGGGTTDGGVAGVEPTGALGGGKV